MLSRCNVITLLVTICISATGVKAADVDLASLLDEMMNRDSIASFPTPAYTCKQASSYDRNTISPTDGWFANNDWSYFYSYEMNDGRKEWIMMDVDGPGAIVRWWITGFGFNGTIRVYVDGSSTPVFQGKADELIGGTILVGSPLSAERSKGRNLYLPIPYSQHCKITYDGVNAHETGDFNDNLYYNINYRTYSPGTTVSSFTMADMATNAQKINDVQTKLLNPETVLGNVTETHSLQDSVGPYASVEMDVPGAGAIRKLKIKADCNNPSNTEQALRNTWVQLYFDNELCAQAPISDFFGSGLGINVFKGWWRTVEADGTFTCYWPMPYQNGAKIRIVNHSGSFVNLDVEAKTGPWQWDSNSMHFHANFRSQDDIQVYAQIGQDWNYVTIQGKGIYAGDTLSLFNPVTDWWGEGDEKVFVDGESFPSHFGTGSEDYYGYAWCWPGLFEAPFHAQPRVDGPANQGNTTNTRVRCLDGITFKSSLQFDMELWHWATTQVDYNATTYWYGIPGASAPHQSLTEPLMSDEFDDPTVNPQWAWLDSDSDDSYNTTDRNGWMRMILNSGSEDHWKDVSGGAPYLLTEMLQVPEFSIITNVDYATANNDQLVIRSLAGIALYDEGNDLDADPFELRFGCEVVDTGLRAMLQIPGQTLASADLPGGTTVSQLKLTRKAADSLWIAYYRTDDLSEWIEVGRVFDTTLPGGATVSPRVGLFGLTWGDTSPASFDFDHYTVEMPCGAWGYLPGDINKDCHVDFVDFAELASNWLKCSMPQQQGCEGY